MFLQQKVLSICINFSPLSRSKKTFYLLKSPNWFRKELFSRLHLECNTRVGRYLSNDFQKKNTFIFCMQKILSITNSIFFYKIKNELMGQIICYYSMSHYFVINLRKNSSDVLFIVYSLAPVLNHKRYQSRLKNEQ